MTRLSNAVAAVASVALMVAPTMASASSAAPTEVAPASETVEGQEIYGASILLQLGILIGVIGLGYLAYTALKGDDKPASP